ncbi:MAG: ATP-dependent zinc metalloprotease FtsH [Spirochaetales bacterium]|nr:ATP-dependent zinc metalloprotease FtsH [Spirochaetales bacterium]
MSDQVGRNAFDVPSSSESESTGEKPRDWRRKIVKWLPLILFAGIILGQLVIGWGAGNQVPTVEYSVFKERVAIGEITRVEIGVDNLVGLGIRSDAAEAVPLYQSVPVDDPSFVDLLDEHNVEYYAVPERSTGWLTSILGWLLPLGLIFYFWRRMSRKGGVMGSDILSIGKNKSRIVAEGETGVTFDDVAGVDEAKAELEEIVDFLKNPDRYSEIGGRIPKGILLVGAPGTGKTLLARAVAGEAGVPFFRLSGADFVEMFVGVGASRVRDLFKQARGKSPAIVFIDELDAIGKSRATAGMGSNDEREQTLNQLLVEMDGFDATTGVIVLAATNRPEILDPALLRPGRFDRQVLVDKPDLIGRQQILVLHAEKVKLDPAVDMNRVARGTAGLAGADLANIVNEAALLAVRSERKRVTQEDFSEAIEKTLAGLSRPNRLVQKRERNIVAYHETGHALMAHMTPNADPVEKISIVPRGLGALGYTLQLPAEERLLLTRSELLGRIDVLLAGRAVEEIEFEDVSTGAGNDLTRAAEIARKMITDYGMSDKFRNVYLPSRRGGGFLDDGGFLQREYSETTQTYIDEETARVIDERYNHVLATLSEKRPEIERVAETLLSEEVVERERFEELIQAVN